jgi:hypothetical protein
MNAEEVLISVNPWVPGTNASRYGTCMVEGKVIIGHEEDSLIALLYQLRDRCIELECNAVVGLEIVIDLWADGGWKVQLGGTATLLVPYFGGPNAL